MVDFPKKFDHKYKILQAKVSNTSSMYSIYIFLSPVVIFMQKNYAVCVVDIASTAVNA